MGWSGGECCRGGVGWKREGGMNLERHSDLWGAEVGWHSGRAKQQDGRGHLGWPT